MKKKKQIDTTRLVVVAFFIAAEVILTRYFSIMVAGIVRIGFGFLPVAMLAILYGPLWAGAAYAIGDIVGMMLMPGGSFFPGFTLSAYLTGLIFGLVLYGRKVNLKTSFLASLLVIVPISLGLDTLWLVILMRKGFFAILPMRLIKAGVFLVLETVLIPLVWNQAMMRVPYVKNKVKGNVPVGKKSKKTE